MSKLTWFFFGAVSLLIVAACAAVIAVTQAHGFSAREQPTAVERWIARSARSLALPVDAKTRTNPVGHIEWYFVWYGIKRIRCHAGCFSGHCSFAA